MRSVLEETVGSYIGNVKRIKTDGAKNLCLGAVEKLCKMFNITQDKSSAHHPSGIRCIENAVQRIKWAIGDRKIDEAMTDINALNNGSPYDGKTLIPAEELSGLICPVPGIPMTKEAEKF